MFKELIQTFHNDVKTIHVAEHNRNLIQEQSTDLHRLIVTKLPDRSDVSFFVSKLNKGGLKESTIVINKEEALILIYALKEFIDITNEDIQMFEESLVI